MDFDLEASVLWVLSCALWEVHPLIYSNTKCLPVLPLVIWVNAIPDECPGLQAEGSG